MDFTKMYRDNTLKHKILVSDGKRIVAKEDFLIVFPSRFLNVGLAEISRTVNVVGIYAFVQDNKYCVGELPAKLSLTPSVIKDLVIHNKPYKELSFKKGQIVYNDNKYIPDKGDIYTMLEEFIVKSGNIPLYMGYEDLINTFIKGSTLTGAEIGSSIIDIALLVSIVARDKNNDYLRGHYTRKEIIEMSKPIYVGLTDFNKGFGNVASLISAGAYLRQGTTAAINMDNPPPTDMGKVLSK